MDFNVTLRIISPPDAGLLTVLNQLIQGVTRMDATLQTLVDEVTKQTGTVESMKTFVGGLEERLRDALTGERLSPEAQTKVNQLFSQLQQNTQGIADAIDNDPATGGGGQTPPEGGGEPAAAQSAAAAQQHSRGR